MRTTVVQIRLFGGVEVTDAGRPVALGPAKRRAVLAALALSAGASVPQARLVELVWGPDPPRAADKTLQAHVARLRAALGRDVISRVGDAYRLDVPAEAVDVLRFARRLDLGDVDGALDEWTGPPLTGVDVAGFAPTVERLAEQRLGAVEAQLGELVATDPAACVARLTELTAAHPFREELWALLMTALYRLGRQSDALATYRAVRDHLAAELGVEPGPRLRELEAAILAHDDRLAPAVAAPPGGAPPGEAPARGGTLPARVPALVGRDADRGAVVAALEAGPVVTLVGPGGIGKTQLALAAAHARVDDVPDGVWLVELAPVASAADVPRVVADALGVVERPGADLTAAIVATLRDRTVLLVVDNCEHLVAGVAELVAAIVAGCPDVRVLATSRERLGITGEQVHVVPPLGPGAGAALFAARAAAAAAAPPGPADAPVVARICERLDGLPLAIELAAARTATLTPDQLLDRLDDALRLLADHRRDDLVHHRTLDATIRWSHDLLTDPERMLLARVSVFAAWFDLDAATAVGTGGGLDAVDVAVLLGRLADRSMVVVDAGPGRRRFRLLETVRRFAADQLAARGDTAAVADRHAAWCAASVAYIGQLLAGPDELDGVERLTALWPDLRTAVDRACATADRSLLDALLRPIVGEIILRSQVELGDWVERLLALTPADDTVATAAGLGWAAQRYTITRDPEGFDDLLARHGPPDHLLVRHARAFAHDDYAALAELGAPAVDELHRQGQHHLAELTEPDRGVALLNLGRLDEADAHLAPLVDRYRAQGPPTLLNWALMLRGYVAMFAGDREVAEELFAAAVDVPVPPRTHTPNRSVEARIAWRRGQAARAVALLRAHVDELVATGNMQAASLVALELVVILSASDRPSAAARVLGYLRATGLLDAPGFAALVAGPAARLTADDTWASEIAAGARLDDAAALADMRRLLSSLP